ncbi:3-oxoacyl-ACP reductase FabG [Halanaerobiaceae bacterium Z-7014]|uniref:3-oxoacyl-ACP reductase FabG n=1 Tax=Halonatronomonas betaini TaxID=2778430 RepID=A0A931AVH2_9FIRM|nr:3-oxoacyl-ACP reductase FabG [Halonatronomonas betaini]MBF8437240.1 3-oxoacyl-ACP reductase FabG [Halonatronomonas betaini]
MNVKNKIVVITGGARGIGKQTAEVFKAKDAKVIIADYDEENGEKTASDLNIEFIRVDVSDQNSVKNLFSKIDEKYGQLDVLINNAGTTADGFLVKMDEDAWDKVIDVNLKGVFNCGKEAAKRMMNKGEGVIINTASVVGLYGNVGQTNYAASKFGVIGLTKTWSKELAPKGVRVNAVAPGFVETEMLDSVPDKILDDIRNKTPLKRLGKTEDIANAYLYLASEEASFVNGNVLSVDGGLVLG